MLIVGVAKGSWGGHAKRLRGDEAWRTSLILRFFVASQHAQIILVALTPAGTFIHNELKIHKQTTHSSMTPSQSPICQA